MATQQEIMDEFKRLDRNPKTYTHEIGLITTGKVTYQHHNDTVVYFEATAAQEDGWKDAREAQYWYRAMIPDDYAALRKTGQLPQDSSYGGIATNRKYCKDYMGNKSTHTHLVEFCAVPPLNLYDEFTNLKPKAEPKGEGNGGTFGLGLTGHHQGRAGAMFNQWLLETKITWKIVNLVVPNPLG